MSVVLDTDALTVLERGGLPSKRLVERLNASGEDIATTVVSYEEQMCGWLAQAARTTSREKTVAIYESLERHIAFFNAFRMLSFDQHAAQRFDEMRAARIRIGTMDLRIACIALVNDALVITRNTRDFGQVPGLRFDDWSR